MEVVCGCLIVDGSSYEKFGKNKKQSTPHSENSTFSLVKSILELCTQQTNGQTLTPWKYYTLRFIKV
jgi:hypothetical protein